jgi:hypothetical protein
MYLASFHLLRSITLLDRGYIIRQLRNSDMAHDRAYRR